MKRWSQRDSRWNNTYFNGAIKSPKTTVGTIGCAVTSVCMVHSKFYPRNPITPLEAAKTWKFTRNGLLIWGETDFPGMKFVVRKTDYNKDMIKEYAKDKNKGVIVEVNRNHWCAVWGWSIFGPVLFDPWDGKIYWKVPKKYRISGFALFSNLEEI